MENLGYEPLRLPVQDSSLRTRLVESGNLKTFFKIWDGVLQANLGVTDSSGVIFRNGLKLYRYSSTYNNNIT